MSTATTSTTSVPRPRGEDIAVVPISKPTTTLTTVDPATAARWLERNGANRTVRARQVAKFAADIRAGRWSLTGAPIQFATDGRLLDGQHRLHAIVEAGVTVQLFVTRGLPPEAQNFMDTGAKRTLADQLTINGQPHSSIVAAGARLAFAWLNDQLDEPRNALSDPQIREFVDANPAFGEAAALMTSHGGFVSRARGSGSGHLTGAGLGLGLPRQSAEGSYSVPGRSMANPRTAGASRGTVAARWPAAPIDRPAPSKAGPGVEAGRVEAGRGVRAVAAGSCRRRLVVRAGS